MQPLTTSAELPNVPIVTGSGLRGECAGRERERVLVNFQKLAEMQIITLFQIVSVALSAFTVNAAVYFQEQFLDGGECVLY